MQYLFIILVKMQMLRLVFVLCILAVAIFGKILSSDSRSSLPPTCNNGGPMMQLAFVAELTCLRRCCEWCRGQLEFGSAKGRCVGECEQQYLPPNQEMAKEKGLERNVTDIWWACCCKQCQHFGFG